MKYLLSLGVLFVILILPLPSNSIDWSACSEQNENCVPNLILNSSFEEGDYSPTGTPTYWERDAWRFSSDIFNWDDTQSRTGDKSVKIDAQVINDARWLQTVDVEPNSWYFLSGWIKTENVAHAAPGEVDAGANLMLFGTWERSAGVFGTKDWTRNSLIIKSGDEPQVTIGGRLGYWGGATSGTAWFDDLQLKQIVPMDPHPSWKILVLIYQRTDFEVTDGEGIFHHYVATMTQDEMERAAQAATAFVETDIPALTSGNMIPSITVRYPEHALTQLSPIGGGWWPSPADTAADRDPLFDSVIVIWDTRATDTQTGTDKWIGFGDGLAAHVGTGQTYNSLQIDAAINRGHRNVFKHEWGHSILFHFDAMGLSPKPTIDNHAEPKEYVNCITGEFYVWVDESPNNPNIPNSIYNNESGFTHDYYSGLTATAEQPDVCLGVTPEAWAYGGPVTHSGNVEMMDETFNVEINVKPRNKRNVINPRKRGGVWVAILSDADSDYPFDPTEVIDVDSVEFGPDGAKAKRYKIDDVNDDGFGDLLLRFKVAHTGISCGDTDVMLIGETFDGREFSGTDNIKTVGCRHRKHHNGHHHGFYKKYYHDYDFEFVYDFLMYYFNKHRHDHRYEEWDDEDSWDDDWDHGEHDSEEWDEDYGEHDNWHHSEESDEDDYEHHNKRRDYVHRYK